MAAQDGSAGAAAHLDALRPALESAAELGDAECQNVLGGVLLVWDEDPGAAAGWFRRAAESGDNEARRTLGYLYVEGAGVEKDLAAAEVLFRAAAEGGDVIASHNLGVFLLEESDERGEPVDVAEVVRLLRVAAEADVDEAAAKLGDVLSDLDEDAEALRWYERAAALGHIDAMFAAGSWFRDGIGTDVDNTLAVKWFLKMLDAHRMEGVHEVLALAGRLTDEEIRRGGHLAGKVPEAEKIIEMRNR
ncbi:tetratricopeptide repeat protein [Streptomyces atratus]|uniref:tetratricopeptide repeat protein n=1 Tax=Streptomyces atratus TaxID=1893 RepID=UPI0033F9CE14